ncbi:MAG: 50S ribosomal protein L6 [Chloroflexota bacterium]|nr:50S ribosomal protein L6 [Chloroflexota bacterium]
MSRIGRAPIQVPNGVNVVVADGTVTVRGPKGELSQQLVGNIEVAQEDSTIEVRRTSEEKYHRSLHGLTRTLINNMVTGVTTGFRKDLEIAGVGYRAALEGRTLVLSLGYSHPVRMQPPDGVTFVVESPTRVSVQGIDKQLVGEQAAKIRSMRKPEPYKGKGIRYAGETIRRKAGKAGKAGGRK